MILIKCQQANKYLNKYYSAIQNLSEEYFNSEKIIQYLTDTNNLPVIYSIFLPKENRIELKLYDDLNHNSGLYLTKIYESTIGLSQIKNGEYMVITKELLFKNLNNSNIFCYILEHLYCNYHNIFKLLLKKDDLE